MTRIKGITDEYIVEMYKNGTRVVELATIAGISPRGIRNILYKSGIENLKQPRKYAVNESFFKTYTNEMVYALGMIITDGCVTKKPEVYNTNFSIAQSDKEFLQKLLDIMGSKHPIRKDARSTVHRFFIGSQEMVNDLIGFGIGERKSLNVKFPIIPNEFKSHFIRGVIDGDGWVCKRGYSVTITSASESFANSLLRILSHQGFDTRIRVDITEGHSTIYRVTVSGKEQVLKLADWIYADAGDLFLKRKKDNFYINS